MNTITTLTCLTGAACLLLFASCDQTSSHIETPALPESYLDSPIHWRPEDYTDWKSRAELQVLMERIGSENYFAAVEGRSNNGFLQYRAVVMPFDDPQYRQWAVFWGLDEEELFQAETKLLREGFKKLHIQAFADAAGKVRHQMVYLQPAGGQPEVALSATPPTATGIASNPEPRQAQDLAPVIPPPATAVIPVSNASPVRTEVASSEDLPKVVERVAPSEPAMAAIDEPTPETGEPVIPEATGKASGMILVSATQPQAPSPATKPAVKTEESPAAKPERKAPKPTIYKVVKGDTLGRIARKNDTTVNALMKENGLKSDLLSIGQKLRLP